MEPSRVECECRVGFVLLPNGGSVGQRSNRALRRCEENDTVEIEEELGCRNAIEDLRIRLCDEGGFHLFLSTIPEEDQGDFYETLFAISFCVHSFVIV